MQKRLVTGAEQVGKTTLVNRIGDKAHLVEVANWNEISSFVLIIDLSNRSSIMNLYQLIPYLLSKVHRYTSLLLIGNKREPRRVSQETVDYTIKRFLTNEFSNVTYHEVDLLNDSDDVLLHAVGIQ